MNGSASPFDQFFGRGAGGETGVGYHCNKCKYEMDKFEVKDFMGFETKKLFFCTNNKCERFGLMTVVAIKKSKSRP